jgi:hypothetical protein
VRANAARPVPHARTNGQELAKISASEHCAQSAEQEADRTLKEDAQQIGHCNGREGLPQILCNQVLPKFFWV